MQEEPALRQNARDRRAAIAGRWLAVVAAIFGATSGLLAKYWNGAPWLILSGTAIVAAIAAVFLTYNKSSTEARITKSKWQNDARTLLQIEVATTTANIDPYLIGTKLSRHARGSDPYVARNVDKRLRAALRVNKAPYPFIVVTGEQLSGKTRTAFEAVDAVLSNSDLIVPREGFKSIRALLDLTPTPEIEPGTVAFWLDDINDFSSATVGLVSRMKVLGPTICTIRTQVIDSIRSGTANGAASGRAIIADARQRDTFVKLALDLEADELSEAQATYPDDGITASIGKSLAAALPTAARLESGRAGSLPGYSLAKAVADCVHFGLPNDFSFIDLRRLFSSYSPSKDFDEALSWCKSAGINGEESYPILVEPERDSFCMPGYVSGAFDELFDGNYSVNGQLCGFLLARYEPSYWIGLGTRAMEIAATEMARDIFEKARNTDDPLVVQLATLGLAALSDEKSERHTKLLASLESTSVSEFATANDFMQLLIADQVKDEDPDRALAIYRDLRTRASGTEKAQVSLKAARLTKDERTAIELAEEASLLGIDDPELHAEAQILIGQLMYKNDRERGLKILCEVAVQGDLDIATRAALKWKEVVGEPDSADAIKRYEEIFRNGPESIAGLCALSFGLKEEKTNPRKSRDYFARAAAAPVADVINYFGARGWLQALKGDPRVDIDAELAEASHGFNENISAVATLERAYRAGKNDLRFVQGACQRVMETKNKFLAERAAGYLATLIRKERPQAAARLLEPLLESKDDEIRSNARMNMVRIIRKSNPQKATEIAAAAMSEETGEWRFKSALRYAAALQRSNPSYSEELYALAATSSQPETRCGAKIFLAGFIFSRSKTEVESMIESVIAEGIPEFSVTAAIMMSRLWFEIDRTRSDAWMRRADEITASMPPRNQDPGDAGEFELDLDDLD